MKIKRTLSHFAVTVAVVSLSSAIGVLGTSLWRARDSDSRRSRNTTVPEQIHSGIELRLILIGASTCGASTNDSLRPAFSRVRSALSQIAEDEGKHLRVVGVSLDWSIPRGLDFLEKFGRLDEINVGANWLNGASVTYILRDLPGTPAIPQLVLIERDVMIDGTGATVSPDRLLARKLGVRAIRAWAEELHRRARTTS